MISLVFLTSPGFTQAFQASLDVLGVDELIEDGKYKEASRRIRRSFNLVGPFVPKSETTTLFVYLGRLLVETGELKEAEKALRTAEHLDSLRQGWEATLPRDRAVLALARRDYSTAATTAAEACRLAAQKVLSRIRVSYCLSIEALARLRLGQIERADQLSRKAQKRLSSRGSKPLPFGPRILYAACLVKSYGGNHTGAEEDCQRGLKMAQARPDSRDVALGYLALAEVYLRAGKLLQSRESSLNCLERTTRLIGPMHQDTIQALELLALADLREGRSTDARIRAEDAVRIAKVVFGEGSPGMRGPTGTLEQVLKAADGK